jgi:hypothetical protein
MCFVVEELSVKVSLASVCVAVLLAGCGNSVAASPSVITNGTQTSHLRSLMNPTAAGENLVYISTFPFSRASEVEVYTYGERSYVGILKGINNPQTLCSDKAGNVFVPEGSDSKVLEFAHGGTSSIATFNDAGHSPRACSADKVTGNVAVIDGGVAIYQNASTHPTRHQDAKFASYHFCGYDDSGNLFVDGNDDSGRFAFAELPKGANTFININLGHYVAKPGSVQWDGKYMAVSSDETVYRFTITGETGELEGSTNLLGGDGPIEQVWLPRFGKRISNPQAKHALAAQYHFFRHEPGDVGFWSYPNAGGPTHLLRGPDHPAGVTVSVAPK